MSVAIAGLAFLFVGSNGIAYAATGSTWVSKVISFTTGNGTDVEIVQEDNSLSYQISREKEIIIMFPFRMENCILSLTISKRT